MIYDNLGHFGQYFGLSPQLDTALSYLESHDLWAMKPGKYEIAGSDVRVTIFDNMTRPPAEAVYEAHRRYADIQVVLRGSEVIRCAFRDDMLALPGEQPDRDISFYAGEGRPFVLRAGEFLILFPDDVHAPSLCVDQPAPVRKAVFKVRLT